jgi:hypothetical protein
MGAPTGFHPNHDWSHLGHKGHQAAPRYTLPQHEITGVIETYDMTNLFGNVNPEYANLWHWTRLLRS